MNSPGIGIQGNWWDDLQSINLDGQRIHARKRDLLGKTRLDIRRDVSVGSCIDRGHFAIIR